MTRLLASLMLVAASGCVIVEPRVTNPLPNVTRVAVVPFANHSVEPAVDTVLVTNAYYAELQKTPGFEVVPISITARAIENFDLRMESPRDALELARVLDVDAVVVGAVTDFDPYNPPRIGWHVEWYSPHSPDFARGVPVDASLRPDLPPLPEGDGDECGVPAEGDAADRHCAAPATAPAAAPRTSGGTRRTRHASSAGRSSRWQMGVERGARVRGQSPDEGFGSGFDGLAGGVANAVVKPVEVRGQEMRVVDPATDPTGPSGSWADRRLGAREPEPLFPAEASPVPTPAEPPFPFERFAENETVVDPVAEEVADERSSETVEDDSVGEFESVEVDAPREATPTDEGNPMPTLPPPSSPDPPRFELLPPPSDRQPPPVTGTPGVTTSRPPAAGARTEPLDVAAVRRSMAMPFDSQRPIMAYTRVFDAKDQDLLARLRDYYELNGDDRAGGWRGYLQRSEDFVRFTAHVAIVEMLTLHGGETRRRYVWKFRTRS